MRVETEAMSLKEPQTGRESTRHSHTAVILAHNLKADGFGSPMPEVGALPILLRSILGAVKAGAARIVVVIDRARGSRIQHDLLQTGRLPRTLEWCEVNSGQASLPSLLGRFASELEGHLVLIAGDRTYHPSLMRRAAEWDGDGDALALVTGGELVGIYALSREVSIDLARGCASSASSIEELNDWLTSTCSVHCEPVPEDKWQRILTEQQRLSAEQKLDGWLVKPTDGIFARTNRRVSIPISRQIIRFPITPNMVSLFTLAVSFAAGVFFALGSRRMRRRGRPFETPGIRFRLLVGDDLRLSLLFIHFCRHDDRPFEDIRHTSLPGMGRLSGLRRDCQLPHHRAPAASPDHRASRTILGSVAKRSRQSEFESFLVSRAAH